MSNVANMRLEGHEVGRIKMKMNQDAVLQGLSQKCVGGFGVVGSLLAAPPFSGRTDDGHRG